jgi:hypothetical protein
MRSSTLVIGAGQFTRVALDEVYISTRVDQLGR